MSFQLGLDLHELFVDLWHPLFHLGNRLRCSDTGDNVFPLSVDKKFTIKLIFSGRRITSKCNTRSTIIAHIAEDHCLNVHSRTQEAGNFFNLTVGDRSGSIPTIKHGAN